MTRRNGEFHRELINAEQALADVKAQLAHEQANRRQWEADYRAEATESFADAWDEGYKARQNDLGAADTTPNPYRTEADL